MSNSSKIIAFTLMIAIFTSFHKNGDSDYFNGEIKYIEENAKGIKKVTLKAVLLNGANYGYMSVYDSLMIFMNPKLPDYFFHIFNVDTGEEIGSFCRRGGGPGELFSVNPVFQFFKENGDLKTLLFASNESKLSVWNISRSVEQRTTVMDTVISYNPGDKNGNVQYKEIFYQSKDTLLADRVSSPLNDRESTTPFYEQRTMYTDKLLRKYAVYKKNTIIAPQDAAIISESFLSSNDAFKPDGSKIVQAMSNIPQLNILDAHTGEVVGYRMKGGPDFSLFETEMNFRKVYYIRIQADDNFIYTSWWGKEPWAEERNEIPSINTIHMLDWHGNLINEFITDQPVHEIWLDQVRNRLYTTNMATDKVFYLDLNESK
ncbi:MAG: TolB-like 6-bladed beta-propeller domain-containing protein [Tannerella sp.]|jgi:hypothetical protein|nr:TolB-like 6-bladed beta-propeller domain-containing protein [Tannerella sp.]